MMNMISGNLLQHTRSQPRHEERRFAQQDQSTVDIATGDRW